MQVLEHLIFTMSQTGSTINQIGRQVSGDASEESYRDAPVWHRRAALIEHLAVELRVDREYYGPDRVSNDFYDAVDQEISKLRRKGMIADWSSTIHIGVFRLKPEYKTSRKPPAASEGLQSSNFAEGSLDNDLEKAFVSILKRGSKANTYKFALARALLEHCRKSEYGDKDAYSIPYSYLADRFLEYYWHQVCKFRIKQDFQRDNEPRVVQTIQSLFVGRGYDFSKIDNSVKEQARKEILKNVFGHARSSTSLVVPRFQKIKEGRYATSKNLFYDYDDDRKMIHLRPEAFSFFKKNNSILSMAVLAEWAKFLEKINGSLPRLVAKIEADIKKRKSLVQFRDAYYSLIDHCFYCCNKLEHDYTHVDHFLPWSYIFEDEAWNLVLACRGCNLRKSDSLAQEEFRDELIKRNRDYKHRVPLLKKSLVLIETKMGWEKEIQNHYTTCQEYGFSIIKMP